MRDAVIRLDRRCHGNKASRMPYRAISRCRRLALQRHFQYSQMTDMQPFRFVNLKFIFSTSSINYRKLIPLMLIADLSVAEITVTVYHQ